MELLLAIAFCLLTATRLEGSRWEVERPTNGSAYESIIAVPDPRHMEEFTFRMRWAGDAFNHSALDICSALRSCFEHLESTEQCQRRINMGFEIEHSGLLIKGQRIVGHVGVHRHATPKYAVFDIRAVCIDRGFRLRGLGKRMVQQTLDAVAKVFGDEPQRTLLSLDVDFASATAADAFAFYARLGFMRWIAPCERVGARHMAVLEDEGRSSARSIRNSFEALYRRPGDYIKQAYDYAANPAVDYDHDFQGDSGAVEARYNRTVDRVPTGLCMFKWHSDSLHSVGRALVQHARRTECPSGGFQYG